MVEKSQCVVTSGTASQMPQTRKRREATWMAVVTQGERTMPVIAWTTSMMAIVCTTWSVLPATAYAPSTAPPSA